MSEIIDMPTGAQPENRAEEAPGFVDVPPARFLAIEGMGDPDGDVFQRRLGYLNAVEQRLRSSLATRWEAELPGNLEVFFWGVKGPGDFFDEPRSDWNWRLAVRIPPAVTVEEVADVKAALLSEGNEPELDKVRIFEFHEGRCVQVLHTGPVGEIRRSVERISDYARKHRLSFHGLHHEVYLGGTRTIPSGRVQTVVRMPVC